VVKDQEYEGRGIEGCDRRGYCLRCNGLKDIVSLSQNIIRRRVDVLNNELVTQVTEVWLL
jgi:hypothetical protein